MEAAINTTPISTPPISTPAPQVVATPPPAPIVNNTTPILPDNVTTINSGSSVSGYFNSLNWVEVGFGILGVAALSYLIFYYRYKLGEDKMINNELQRQIDEIKINLQTAMKGKYKTI